MSGDIPKRVVIVVVDDESTNLKLASRSLTAGASFRVKPITRLKTSLSPLESARVRLGSDVSSSVTTPTGTPTGTPTMDGPARRLVEIDNPLEAEVSAEFEGLFKTYPTILSYASQQVICDEEGRGLSVTREVVCFNCWVAAVEFIKLRSATSSAVDLVFMDRSGAKPGDIGGGDEAIRQINAFFSRTPCVLTDAPIIIYNTTDADEDGSTDSIPLDILELTYGEVKKRRDKESFDLDVQNLKSYRLERQNRRVKASPVVDALTLTDHGHSDSHFPSSVKTSRRNTLGCVSSVHGNQDVLLSARDSPTMFMSPVNVVSTPGLPTNLCK